MYSLQRIVKESFHKDINKMWFEMFQRIFFFRTNQLARLAQSKDGTPAMVALEEVSIRTVMLPFESEEEDADEEVQDR